jgi:hypothetical protein
VETNLGTVVVSSAATANGATPNKTGAGLVEHDDQFVEVLEEVESRKNA